MPHNGAFQTDRRNALKALAAALGLTGTGIGVIALTSDQATAQITIGNLDVPDANFQDTDGEPAGVYVYIDGRFKYATDTTPATYVLHLFLRDTGGGFHSIDSAENDTVSREDTGSFSLGGDILDTNAYDASDFRAPGPGRSRTVHVPLGVLIQVLDSEGTVLAGGRATRVVRISVTETELSAEVGAEGRVVFQNDSVDPTPTPPS